MTGTFRIREIAAQAGLSEATVDRVLHRRGGVRASTVEEVHQAIADLERQRSQLRIAGRTFMVDVVVQAPARFSVAVRTALEALQHDLRQDLRRACQVIMQAQHALAGPIVARPSNVQVITPHNVPPALVLPD